MDGVHHPSSTQLRHQQQLFGLLARAVQWGQVEKSPSSIWGTLKDVFMICPPRTVFSNLAARLTSLLVASQRCCCRVLLVDLIDCGMASSRRSKSVWCRFGMSQTWRFHVPGHFESSKLNLGNSHVSMTSGMRWSKPIPVIQGPTGGAGSGVPYTPPQGMLEVLARPVFWYKLPSWSPSNLPTTTLIFSSRTLAMDCMSHYLMPGHHEMATGRCWRSITRWPKKQSARFYSMKCRSLVQKCIESPVWYKHHIHHRMAWCT